MDVHKAGQRQRSKRKMRNFLLQPLVQIRLGLYSIILAAIFSFAVMYILYINLADFAEIVLTLTDSESEIRELFENYMVQTKWWVVLVIVSFLITNVTVSVVYTHKLVGPTIAFRKQISRLMQGNYTERINLRKGDAFKELADELNQLTEFLQNNQSSREPPKQA